MEPTTKVCRSTKRTIIRPCLSNIRYAAQPATLNLPLPTSMQYRPSNMPQAKRKGDISKNMKESSCFPTLSVPNICTLASSIWHRQRQAKIHYLLCGRYWNDPFNKRSSATLDLTHIPVVRFVLNQISDRWTSLPSESEVMIERRCFCVMIGREENMNTPPPFM